MGGEEKLEEYYASDTRKPHRMVGGILSKFGGIYQKGRDDFYFLTNEVLTGVCQTYDMTKSSDRYTYSCLGNRIKTEVTRLNREKRRADRMSTSLEMPVGDEEDETTNGMLISDFDMKKEPAGRLQFSCDERMVEYSEKLSGIQRQIVKVKMEDRGASEIRKRLGLSERQYDRHCRGMKPFDNTRILYREQENRDIGFQKGERVAEAFSQISGRNKQKSYSASSVTRKIDSYTFRFSRPVQREAEQWSPKTKGNLVSDILQDNPISALISVKQIVSGMMITWNLDGERRCADVYEYYHNGFRISRNVRRWLTYYQTVMKDKAGHVELADSYPQYEWREYDICGRKYSELPAKLQERFHDYTFEVAQYLNCSNEGISHHITCYNEGESMTRSQKGMACLGEEFASMAKSISGMNFFKDKGGYKVSEFRNGMMNCVVIESIMTDNFLEDWKKQQEELRNYIRENTTAEDFKQFRGVMKRSSVMINDDVVEMFDSRDNFLWFRLFAGFCKLGPPDEMLMKFMSVFWIALHEKAVDGVAFDDLDGRSTKGENMVSGRIRRLERLITNFLEERC